MKSSDFCAKRRQICYEYKLLEQDCVPVKAFVWFRCDFALDTNRTEREKTLNNECERDTDQTSSLEATPTQKPHQSANACVHVKLSST